MGRVKANKVQCTAFQDSALFVCRSQIPHSKREKQTVLSIPTKVHRH